MGLPAPDHTYQKEWSPLSLALCDQQESLL